MVDGTLVLNKDNAAEFRKGDRIARAMIGGAIGGDQIDHVRHSKTAKEMWEALVAVHERQDDVARARWNAQFWSFRVGEEEKIVAAISRLSNIAEELRQQGEVISETNRIGRLIEALPKAYSSFCSAWDSTPVKERTFRNLTRRLQVEEERRGAGPVTESEALAGISVPRCSCKCTCGGKVDERSRKPVRRALKCFYCNEEGHFKKDCPKRKREVQSYDSEALVLAGEQKCTKGWVLDSVATDHMCPDQELFDNYVPFKSQRKIKTASGDILLAKGKGNIVVLAYNGTEWKKRVLEKALYVPQLKFNLFSLTKAIDKGCKMVVEGAG